MNNKFYQTRTRLEPGEIDKTIVYGRIYMMKNINNKKRFFLKSSSLFFFSLLSFKHFKITFFQNFKNILFKFVKKNKKIWILSKNDFN